MSSQPYPLDIYIDDLLEELNDDHDTAGVPLFEAAGTAPPGGCPSALTALAYADDVTALSSP
jgi:hypothetical protein